MSGRYLLDTNIVIALFAGDAAVQEHVNLAAEVFISSVVLGELYYGVERSARVEENRARVDALASDATILECDVDTARNYGAIKSRLRAEGRLIPENDIWIAATAQQHSLTLVSRDEHFDVVQDLTKLTWETPPSA